ncbi:MAG: L,D-transpeptidase family protein [Gammaproteobacteria bacterium]|nr:L,D-transpeptidase family protein [Gammaproteobacteria bacterium]
MKRCFTLLMLVSQLAFSMAHKIDLDKAVDDAIARYGLKTEPYLVKDFQKAHVQYPPSQVALLAFKKERLIELWAKNKGEGWRYIRNYSLTAFSGRLGPKLREQDGQIPEGIYRLITFNPFSSWHLSMMIDYPNDFDRFQALKEGRHQLGSNIFLHGKNKSVGCLAVGDHAIDQLFLLSRRVGLQHVKLIIAPNDLRKAKPATSYIAQPKWVPQLYQRLTTALREFKEKRKMRVAARVYKAEQRRVGKGA